MKRRKCDCVINGRDIKFLKFLFEQKVCDQKLAMEIFFPETKKSNAIRRFQKLSRSGHILKNYVDNNFRSVLYYSLSPLGFKRISELYSLDSDGLKLKSDSVAHDLELAKIRWWLTKFRSVDRFLSENYLQNCDLGLVQEDLMPFKHINSDGVLMINDDLGNYKAALEYESSKKSPERYVQKLRDYYLMDGISTVLYLCTDQDIFKSIVEVDMELSKKFRPKVFCSIISEDTFLKRSVKLRGFKGGTIILK